MSKKTFFSFLIIFFIFCNKDTLSESEIFLDTFESYIFNQSHSSDYIFNQNNLHRFDIYISDKNLKTLDDDPSAENYVEGSIVFENKIIKKVGIRYKGSIGAWVGCLSGTDLLNPSGYKTCPKLSIKVKINWNNNNKFYGLKKLQFHSQNSDNSKMHERLGYWMYRSFGIPAPRSNHALIYINGEFNGVYANTEHIDGPFVKNQFNDSDGNLYKEIWPIDDSGSSFQKYDYVNALKNNEEIANVSKILNFANEIESSDELTINQVIDKWIDKNQFIKTIVVDRRISHDDGFLHWYGSPVSSFTNHNYFWYENSLSDKFQLIPWDLDNAFDNIHFKKNPVIKIVDKWNETSNNCKGFPYGAGFIYQKSAACDKIIGSYASSIDLYNDLDQVFKDNYFNMSNINNLLNKWSNQIESSVIKANEKFNLQEINLNDWKNEIEVMKNEIELSLN